MAFETIKKSNLKKIIREIIKLHQSMNEISYDVDDETDNYDGVYGGWLDPNGKFHAVNYEQHINYATNILDKLGITDYGDAYNKLYSLGFIRLVFGDGVIYYRYKEWNQPIDVPNQKRMKALKDLAIERGITKIVDCETDKQITDFQESIIKEETSRVGLKFWWMDINYKLHPVRFEEHRYWAESYLHRLGCMNVKDVYKAMFKLGFVRVVKYNYNGDITLSFQYDAGRPITTKQLKEIRDLAIEENCQYIQDENTNRETLLKESSMEKEHQVRHFLSQLNDDNVVITVNRIDELPDASYVQVDGIINGKNVFSSNPEDLSKWGFSIPSTKQLLTLPTGCYKLSDVKSKLKQSTNEDLSYDELLKLTTPERKDRAVNVTARSLPVSVEEGKEQWNFRYKSSPQTTVTDKPFRGSITFLKGSVGQNSNAMKMKCKVDCECPDFMYRFAYNDAAKNASKIGPDSLNGAANRKPKPAYDYGEGLCKHLVALGKFLKTKISSTRKSNLFEAIDDVAKQGPFNVTYYD